MIDIKKLKILKDLNDFKIYLNRKDQGISRTLNRYKFKTKWPREPEFMYIFDNLINQNSNILDLGANIGYLTLYFKKVLKVKNKILAVEPEISNFTFLKENVALNGLEDEVVCKNFALAEIDGFKNFELSSHSNLHKITSKNTSKKVLCKKLSTLLDEEKFKPDFIKMDVEGAEIEVIEGFKDYIRNINHNLSILFEVHPNDYTADRSFTKQLEFLFSNGFYTKSLITAGTKYPLFFEKKGYKPEISFKSGKFKRYIINDVSNQDVVDSINNKILYPERNSILNMFKTFKLNSYSKKIVRGVLLTRN